MHLNKTFRIKQNWSFRILVDGASNGLQVPCLCSSKIPICEAFRVNKHGIGYVCQLVYIFAGGDGLVCK